MAESANSSETNSASSVDEIINRLMGRAKSAQNAYSHFNQARVDCVTQAVAWALMEPSRNRQLAALAVSETGLGDVDDKIRKNHVKTLGLMRDLAGAKTVGVISDDPTSGIIEIARPIGVIAAITPSTNPVATPTNKIINALKGRNAIILAPSPKAWPVARQLIDLIHLELQRSGLAAELASGLVQLLPAPVSKATTHALMAAADLVVATGSQSNIRAAYRSGTPALGVGAGNVAAIVDPSADLEAAASKIAASKTFDHATSCSSENALVVIADAWPKLLDALRRHGGCLLDSADKTRLQAAMWPDGRLSQAMMARPAGDLSRRAGLADPAALDARFLMVEEQDVGAAAPFSGEKLAPVLAVYRARDFADAVAIVARIYDYQGAGHSVGLHSESAEQAMVLAEQLPVSRIIVNQAHCFATGGSFANGLPFSLSMGCGSWGGNGFSSNMNYRHFLNITRIARPIKPREPSQANIFGDYFERFGQ